MLNVLFNEEFFIKQDDMRSREVFNLVFINCYLFYYDEDVCLYIYIYI